MAGEPHLIPGHRPQIWSPRDTPTRAHLPRHHSWRAGVPLSCRQRSGPLSSGLAPRTSQFPEERPWSWSGAAPPRPEGRTPRTGAWGCSWGGRPKAAGGRRQSGDCRGPHAARKDRRGRHPYRDSRRPIWNFVSPAPHPAGSISPSWSREGSIVTQVQVQDQETGSAARTRPAWLQGTLPPPQGCSYPETLLSTAGDLSGPQAGYITRDLLCQIHVERTCERR